MSAEVTNGEMAPKANPQVVLHNVVEHILNFITSKRKPEEIDQELCGLLKRIREEKLYLFAVGENGKKFETFEEYLEQLTAEARKKLRENKTPGCIKTAYKDIQSHEAYNWLSAYFDPTQISTRKSVLLTLAKCETKIRHQVWQDVLDENSAVEKINATEVSKIARKHGADIKAMKLSPTSKIAAIKKRWKPLCEDAKQYPVIMNHIDGIAPFLEKRKKGPKTDERDASNEKAKAPEPPLAGSQESVDTSQIDNENGAVEFGEFQNRVTICFADINLSKKDSIIASLRNLKFRITKTDFFRGPIIEDQANHRKSYSDVLEILNKTCVAITPLSDKSIAILSEKSPSKLKTEPGPA